MQVLMENVTMWWVLELWVFESFLGWKLKMEKWGEAKDFKLYMVS